MTELIVIGLLAVTAGLLFAYLRLAQTKEGPINDGQTCTQDCRGG